MLAMIERNEHALFDMRTPSKNYSNGHENNRATFPEGAMLDYRCMAAMRVGERQCMAANAERRSSGECASQHLRQTRLRGGTRRCSDRATVIINKPDHGHGTEKPWP